MNERLILVLSTVNPGPVDPEIAGACHRASGYLKRGTGANRASSYSVGQVQLVLQTAPNELPLSDYMSGLCTRAAMALDKLYHRLRYLEAQWS